MSPNIHFVDEEPLEYGPYLGWFEGRTAADDSYWGIAIYMKDGWFKGSGNRASGVFNTLTHWTSLPDPPTEPSQTTKPSETK